MDGESQGVRNAFLEPCQHRKRHQALQNTKDVGEILRQAINPVKVRKDASCRIRQDKFFHPPLQHKQADGDA